MNRTTPRIALAIGLMAAAAWPAQAQNWSPLATISTTIGVSASRICVGEGTRGDVGCPSYAPSLTTAGDVSVTGNLSANGFIGDGSGLTGVTASSGDRIVSGTTSMLAVSNTGYVSLTQAGVNTGWFNPQLGLVTLGVSATGPISGSSGYFYGNVGIGTSAPSDYMSSADDVVIYNSSPGFTIAGGNNNTGSIYFADGNTSTARYAGYIDYAHNGDYMRFGTGALERLRINSSGNVGIGTTAPTSALQVSGSFTVSTSAQTTTPSFNVSSNGGVGFGIAGSGTYRVLQDGGIMRIQNVGRLEIDSQNDQALQVLNGSTTYFRIDTLAAGGAGSYFPSGNVGIGTTAPSATLTVSGSQLNTSWTAINMNSTATAPLEVSGTISATRVVAGNFVGDGSGLTGLSTTSDRITSGTSSIIVSQSGHISFTTAGTERMVINSSGNVGIGTSAPNAPLDVVGYVRSSSATAPATRYSRMGFGELYTFYQGGYTSRFVFDAGVFTVYGMNADTTPGVRLNGTGLIEANTLQSAAGGAGLAGTSYSQLQLNSGYFGVSTVTPSTVFKVFNSSGALTRSRMQLYNGDAGAVVLQPTAGNVGIGTTAPMQTLSVSGTAEFVSRTLVGGTGTPSATLQVSGSLLLAGNDNIPCTASVFGLMRRNPTTGRVQMCR